MTEQLPYSREAEESLLGALLIDPDAFVRAAEIVGPEDLHDEGRRMIFKAIGAVERADLLTVSDWLKSSGWLDKVGGSAYFTDLINRTPTSLHVEHYARIVRRDSVRRKAIQAGTEMVQFAYQTPDADRVVARANQLVLNLSGSNNGDGLISAGEAGSQLDSDLRYWQEHPLQYDQVRGLSTGLRDWDRMMGGMQPGDFVVICARPRMGKSALAITSAYRIARTGKRVAFFALEMTRTSLIARLAAAESGVSYKRIKRGVMDGSHWHASPEEFARFEEAGRQVASTQSLYIDDTSNLSVDQIRARAFALSRKLGGLDLMVVDTGNLVYAEDQKGENHAQTESRKVRGLRNLGKELHSVVYMTWQLNRAVESRPVTNSGRRPRLSDLRDTGGVEEHATDVIGLYRDEVYNDSTLSQNMMELIGLKRREDEGNTLSRVGFQADQQRFFDVELRKIEP
jgi:replicative DNA helicase